MISNLVLFVATAVATSGCGQFNKEGKLNPGGCDGPNKYDIDAGPSTLEDAPR
ncbi:MAG: hypothetical protein KBG15_21595 [Kofleriaceae bacterium]|nr:hypothetical protein [Kofleriaceae bacterium]